MAISYTALKTEITTDPSGKLFITGHEYHNYDSSGDYSLYSYEQEVERARLSGF